MDVTPAGTPAELGQQIRRLRRRDDRTQAEIAEQAGVSRQLVVDIEAGKPRLELVGVIAVLEALGQQLAVVPITAGDAVAPDTEVPW